MRISKERKVADIVSENFKTSEVFDNYNIDFCCGGDVTLEEACNKKAVDPDKVQNDLEKVSENSDPEGDFIRQMNPSELIDYIEKRHHTYVTKALPEILTYLDKVEKAHGANHPEMKEVHREFKRAAEQLSQHLKKEELLLFPFIKKMQKALETNEAPDKSAIKDIDDSLQMLRDEHDAEGTRFERISKMTDNYAIPGDACNTFAVALKKLEEFENDLHRHIHLENNILFPEARRMEQRIFGN